MKQVANSQGFTIIEVMIVLVIVTITIMIVFMAVPALMRNSRNTRRDADAAMLSRAVAECLLNKGFSSSQCDDVDEVQPFTEDFRIYTGFHYGGSGPNKTISTPPTNDEPNWLFGLQCTSDLKWFTETDVKRVFVVTYLRESSGGSVQSRCIEG